MKKKSTQTAESQTMIHVRPRYYRLYTDPGVELGEENFRHRELDWHLPLKEAALVCLDVWSYHYS
ncbi:cysteine hydrolase, partial [Verrucomicrobiota bacterium]